MIGRTSNRRVRATTKRSQKNTRSDRGPRLSWRAGRFILLVLFTVGMTATGLYQVNDRYEIVRLGYELDAARTSQRQHLEEQKRLRLRLDTHKHPQSVRLKAADLHMKMASAGDEFYVASDSAKPPAISPSVEPPEAPGQGGAP